MSLIDSETYTFAGNQIKPIARILLVDDEPDIINVLKKGLVGAGYQVDVFTEPQKAIEKYKPNYYDRIISDIRMPGINGFELARQVWAKDQNAQFCFLTSFEILDSEARKVFPNLPSYCFIQKPITPSALAKHIEFHAKP